MQIQIFNFTSNINAERNKNNFERIVIILLLSLTLIFSAFNNLEKFQLNNNSKSQSSNSNFISRIY